MTSETKKPLFDGSSSSDGEDEEDIKLNWKTDLDHSKGSKLAKIKSESQSLDPRFKLNEKFVESSDEDADNNELVDEGKKEQQKNFEILSQVLNKPVFSSEEVKKYSQAKLGHKLPGIASNGLIARFDPTQPDSVNKYQLNRTIINNNDTSTREKVKKSIKNKEITQVKVSVPSERYYQVTANLKDAFTKGKSNSSEVFKLSSLFTHDDDERVETSVESYPSEKSETIAITLEDKHRETSQNVKNQGHVNQLTRKKVLPVYNLRNEKFFISSHDERLFEDTFYNENLMKKFKNANIKGKCKQQANRVFTKWKKSNRKLKNESIKITERIRRKKEKQKFSHKK